MTTETRRAAGTLRITVTLPADRVGLLTPVHDLLRRTYPDADVRVQQAPGAACHLVGGIDIDALWIGGPRSGAVDDGTATAVEDLIYEHLGYPDAED